jgi:hypothetical protein
VCVRNLCNRIQEVRDTVYNENNAGYHPDQILIVQKILDVEGNENERKYVGAYAEQNGNRNLFLKKNFMIKPAEQEKHQRVIDIKHNRCRFS